MPKCLEPKGKIEIAPEMVAAATAALIAWFEGCADFQEGGRVILEAGMLACGEVVNVHADQVGSAD